jgi:uncharacterized protein (TIGR00251 family)
MLELVETDSGTRLKLRVKAGGRKNAILGPHAGALKLSVTAAAERGKANKAVLSLLADALELPASSLEILSGQTSPDKVVLIPLSRERLLQRLP